MLDWQTMKIGVFDSGIGGEAIADTLRHDFPDASIKSVSDRDNMPYGNKSLNEIRSLCLAAIKPLLRECDVIVLACNTATAVALPLLRETYPEQKFVGIEPMIKPAAKQTKSHTIAVCATPATLASAHYMQLVSKYGSHLRIIEPDCQSWAYMIEHRLPFEHEVRTIIDNVCDQGADVIVLGCTHYHWIKQVIEDAAHGRAEVIEPSRAISSRVRELLDS